MPVQSIHHVNLRVGPEELLELRFFYCDVLGLTEGWRPPFASRGYWLYADSLPIVHLVERSPGEPEHRGVGVIDHVALRCSKLNETLAHLRDRGIEFSVTQVPVTGEMQVLLHDPIGTGIELTFSERKSD